MALANGQAVVMFERGQITGIVEVFNRHPNRALPLNMRVPAH
jgi:hypothetical protein